MSKYTVILHNFDKDDKHKVIGTFDTIKEAELARSCASIFLDKRGIGSIINAPKDACVEIKED